MRQRQILTLIKEGKLNKQIAAEFELSEKTIDLHRRRIMKRMGVKNVAVLMRLTEQFG